jgi:dihydroorotate dehydrogenase (fumarate)
MADLSTNYLGNTLKNPIIVSSSSLTYSIDKIVKCADAGAGAVVLKSLFEEQIEAQIEGLSDGDSYPHPESVDYIRQMETMHSQDKYVRLISDAKKAVDIPIISSINAVTPDWWLSCLKEMEEAGADAIELNIAMIPYMHQTTVESVESFYTDVVETVKKEVKIPVAVKLSPYFTSIPGMVKKLERSGADGIVLFNRFYQMDIDLEQLDLVAGPPFSTETDIFLALRWIAILSDQIDISIAASGGVHSGEGVVKLLLSGADAVQICSAVYKNGFSVIGEMLDFLKTWMEKNRYGSIDDFRGKLSKGRSERPDHYERLQYIKALVGIE